MGVLSEQPAPAGKETPPYHKALAWNLPEGTTAAPSEGAAVAPTLRDPAEKPGETTGRIPAGKLTLADFVRLVMTNNQQIQAQKAQWGIQKAEMEKARGIFEPRLVSSLQLEDRSQRNTAEESASRQFTLTYEERNWDFSAAVQGLLPTGGQIQLGYDYRRLSNTLTRTLTDEEREYQMFLGITLTQPLLKNAGIAVTMSGIRVAEAESQVAFQEYRQELMRIVGETAARYWNFYQAQEKLRMREESLRVAEQILQDSEERFRIGKMARTEVLEAKAGVISRLALRSEARQEHLEAVNRLRTLVSMAGERGTAPLEAGDSPKAETSVPDLQAMRQRAFRLRPEYLAAQKKIERAGLKVAYARNQRWPELDLKASFGLNGLDFSRGDSWEQIEDSRFDDWSIGLELNLPLLGNRAGASELEKANLEKKRALLMLKAIEVELTNGIDTAVHNVQSAAEQVDYAGDVVEIHKQLLDAEIARLEAGKSNSRLVLEKEENYRKAQEASLKNLVNLQKALVSLEVAGGMSLVNHGVELMEVEL
ncbi:RND transporter [Desulfuromonas versatilis]|uniref:RND transporter n=1 Tax=Desulfuromonas versatilis TaxID=2802975 RepID=A0ABM8HQV0_9BACT|nr:TolC family protein [Desulfuromonas versatilis]BCR04255.1 RND transporter [Desulfuromonas versatilis]